MAWHVEQEWERQWWGTCVNTFAEETKQITYAHRMGLQNVSDGAHWPYYDLEGKSVLDIGGGPVSMLLKTHNASYRKVVDPCRYPAWVYARYEIAGINWDIAPGENFDLSHTYDEVWIYNVLQHTDDPELIIANAREVAQTIRIFEWIDIPAHPGHPQMLTKVKLDEWLQGDGTVEDFRGNHENGCNQVAYYGVFRTTQ
jgi:2-polyprenyl-3-methyl-5-hydroxy-6-metoxy-1,4-benzoquinol methylase